jgi:hypothetical protein
MEGGWFEAGRLRGVGHGAHQNVRVGVATQAEATAADAKKAGTAALEHLQAAAGANAEFRHAAHPGRLTGNFGNVSPFAAAQQFQRKEKVCIHRFMPLNGSS